MNLNNIKLNVISFNERAIKCIKSVVLRNMEEEENAYI